MNNQLTPQDIRSIAQSGEGYNLEFKTERMFTVVFHRIIAEKTVEKTVEKSSRERIIDLIKDNPSITTKELANSIGVSNKAVGYHINVLQKEGILTREGSKKSGRWIVNEKGWLY